MVEIIAKIKTAEENAEEIRRAARREAARLKEEAAGKGRQFLENEASSAAKEAAEIIQAAEDRAEQHLEKVGVQSNQTCQQLKAAAEGKMEKASKFILERIVDSL